MIYLDNAATTKPYYSVITKIRNILVYCWGNASSQNSFGEASRRIIESVREEIADDINCDPSEIIFTSGGCEANSMALGLYPSIITTRMEHKSISSRPYNPTDQIVKVDKYGFVDFNSLERAINEQSKWQRPFVVIQAANSEIGTIQPIRKIADLTHDNGGIFFTDATALFPHQRINVKANGIDMMAVSAQKFHATEGVGFLYVKKGIKLNPIIYGSQENGLRGGSYNTALIAGMGKALEVTRQRDYNEVSIKTLRNKLLGTLLCIRGVHLNGPTENRLNNNINVTIDNCSAETLVTMADLMGIIISKGSACQSYDPVPSATLKAIGLTDEQAFNTIRITLDEFNTEKEIDDVIRIIPKLIERIRNNEK